MSSTEPLHLLLQINENVNKLTEVVNNVRTDTSVTRERLDNYVKASTERREVCGRRFDGIEKITEKADETIKKRLDDIDGTKPGTINNRVSHLEHNAWKLTGALTLLVAALMFAKEKIMSFLSVH